MQNAQPSSLQWLNKSCVKSKLLSLPPLVLFSFIYHIKRPLRYCEVIKIYKMVLERKQS